MRSMQAVGYYNPKPYTNSLLLAFQDAFIQLQQQKSIPRYWGLAVNLRKGRYAADIAVLSKKRTPVLIVNAEAKASRKRVEAALKRGRAFKARFTLLLTPSKIILLNARSSRARAYKFNSREELKILLQLLLVHIVNAYRQRRVVRLTIS